MRFNTTSHITVPAMALLTAFTLTIAGCNLGSDSDMDNCESDDDCAGDQRCNHGLTNRCVSSCTKHNECSEDSFCDQHSYFSSVPRCREGCRSHDQCDPGQRCADGVCEQGCRSDDECPTGHCGTRQIFGPYECLEVPEPVACGDQECESIHWLFGRVPACCADAATSACGIDKELLAPALSTIEGAGCIPLRSGALDAECPSKEHMVGCRLESGACGFWIQDEQCIVLDEN